MRRWARPASVSGKQAEDERRGFDRPEAARNILNRLDDGPVEGALDAVRAGASLAHSYYRLKARWLGAEQLGWWDRLSPLPGLAGIAFTWDEARAIVLEAFASFAQPAWAIAGRFFERGWIDAVPRAGKTARSSCYATVPAAHPYIVLNYRGSLRDLLALAHELAHGVHQVMAMESGFLQAAVPPVVAETAAALAEILVLERLVQRSTSNTEAQWWTAAMLEHLVHTIFHHAAIHDFEREVHRARRSGALTVRHVGDLWLKAQGAFLGPAVPIDAGYGHFWACVDHVFRAPFSSYAYAIAAASGVALRTLALARPAVAECFVSMQRSGGAASLQGLLQCIGLSDSPATLVSAGLDAISAMVEELERAPSISDRG